MSSEGDTLRLHGREDTAHSLEDLDQLRGRVEPQVVQDPNRERRGDESSPARVVARISVKGLTLMCTVLAWMPPSTRTSTRSVSIAG